MRVKLFGSMIKDYEETADQWLANHKNLNIKHVAISIGPSGEWVLTAIYYEEKQTLGKEANSMG